MWVEPSCSPGEQAWQQAAATDAARLHLLLLCHVVVWVQPTCALDTAFVQTLHALQVTLSLQLAELPRV